MTAEELDKFAEKYAKEYVSEEASGLTEEMEVYANFFKRGLIEGYNLALGAGDPYGEYFEKDGEEIIDEKFDV